MLTTIRSLEQVQKIDLEIIRIEEEERSFARELEKLSAAMREHEAGLEALAAEMEAISASIKDLDEKIREGAEKVSRDEKRLGSVKNEKEINALTKEITGANKLKKQSEQEKTSLVARRDEKKSSLDAKKAELENNAEEHRRISSEFESKKALWRQSLEESRSKRDSIKASIGPDVIKKYEMIRSKRGGVGLVTIKDEICQGCYTHIPPQVYIQLKKGMEELVFCPHCHRIIYVETPGQLEAV